MASSTPVKHVQTRTIRTRERVRQAALSLFCERGYAAVSMDDVAAGAQCSKGGLYHHFSGKTSVLEAVVRRLAEQGATVPPLATGASRAGVSSASLGRLLVEIWAEAGRSEEIRRALAPSKDLSLDDVVATGRLVESVARFVADEERREAA